MTTKISSALTFLITFTTSGLACTSELELANASCPCVAGYQCCEEDGLCVSEGDTCSNGKSPGQKTAVDESNTSSDDGSGSSATFADADQIALARNESPSCITQDVEHLYWLNADGALSAVPKAGGSVSRSTFKFAPQPTPACALSVDGDSIYITMYGLGSIAKVSLKNAAGGWSLGDQGRAFGSFLTPSSIALDASYIYVSELDSGSIRRVAKEAGAASAEAGAPVIDDLGKAGAKPRDLVVDGDSLYWLDDGGLRKMPKSGGHIVTLANLTPPKATSGSELAVPSHLVLARGQLFWNDDQNIWIMPIGSDVPRKLVLLWTTSSGSSSAPRKTTEPYTAASVGIVTSDGHDVFFTEGDYVKSVSVGGGEMTKLFRYFGSGSVRNDVFARDFMVDSSRLYWIDATTVWMRTR